jgi:TM2 domain-containing membrane protein YozV
MAKSQKSNIAAGLLAIFLGMIGIHEFYLGNVARGLAYLIATLISLLLSLFFIGVIFLAIIEIIAFIEGIVYLCANQEDFDRKYNN